MESICTSARSGSRAAATSKMERFVIIVNGWKLLTIITKHSILDVAAALDPPLSALLFYFSNINNVTCVVNNASTIDDFNKHLKIKYKQQPK